MPLSPHPYTPSLTPVLAADGLLGAGHTHWPSPEERLIPDERQQHNTTRALMLALNGVNDGAILHVQNSGYFWREVLLVINTCINHIIQRSMHHIFPCHTRTCMSIV